MKVLAATLLALLLVASRSPSEAHFDGIPITCCFTYQQRPIPLRLINSTFVTSSSCINPGVIVVTKKGKQLCVNPQEPWVQERLKHFQTPKN
ncbi:C-C motif chemokine 4-like [Empidonax traillii]|uniref:C-C motif chemokine 4-like n=1 Tax=Empidonax traillii TaxID=164674 RepID=UPI000FFD70FC|nr:C-C motif chemokine 4-like [Empidonax traillii]